MKTYTICEGTIVGVFKYETKKEKEYKKIEITSQLPNGETSPVIGKIKDYSNGDYKVGEHIRCVAFQQAELYNGKVYTNYMMISGDKLPAELLALCTHKKNGKPIESQGGMKKAA